MFEIILTFLYSSWQDIIIALAMLILSHYSLKKYITSAEKERLKQAKKCLLDILERRIKNKQDISVDKINNFLESTERKHSVVLSDVASLSSLLQDLQLRFENNLDLDPAEKDEYYELIQELIQEIRLTEELLVIPKKYSGTIDTLTEEIKSKNTESALENLELLKRKITKREEHIKGFGLITISTSLLALMIASTYLLITIFNINFFISFLMSFVVIITASIILDSLKGIMKRKKLL